MNVLTKNIKKKAWTYELVMRNFFGATTHAPSYLAVADTAFAFLIKKRKLLQKSLIVFNVLAVLPVSTNYLALQLTLALGSIIIWSGPLDLKVLEERYSSKLNEHINTARQLDEDAIVLLGGGCWSIAIAYPQY